MEHGEHLYEFLQPWLSTDGQDARFHQNFLNEVMTEVGPGHMMYGLPVRLIGRDASSDDTLFEILDGSGRLARVHLTWSKGQERLPWPHTQIYPDFDAFAADEMIPKYREYLDR